MKEAAIVGQKQAAELRRMAKTTREAEREKKLLGPAAATFGAPLPALIAARYLPGLSGNGR